MCVWGFCSQQVKNAAARPWETWAEGTIARGNLGRDMVLRSAEAFAARLREDLFRRSRVGVGLTADGSAQRFGVVMAQRAF